MKHSRRSFFQTSAIHASAGAMGIGELANARVSNDGAISRQGQYLLSRMSHRAKRAIRFAMDEALEMHLPGIDSPCLLIGLAGEAELSGAGWLSALELTLDDLRQVRDALIGRSHVRSRTSAPLSLDAQCRMSLQYATEHADLMGYQRVQPEHILLGLIDDPSFASNELLDQMWIESTAVELEAIASLPSWGSVHHHFE